MVNCGKLFLCRFWRNGIIIFNLLESNSDWDNIFNMFWIGFYTFSKEHERSEQFMIMRSSKTYIPYATLYSSLKSRFAQCVRDSFWLILDIFFFGLLPPNESGKSCIVVLLALFIFCLYFLAKVSIENPLGLSRWGQKLDIIKCELKKEKRKLAWFASGKYKKILWITIFFVFTSTKST